MSEKEPLSPASNVNDAQLSRLGDFMAADSTSATPDDMAAATQLTLSRSLADLLSTQQSVAPGVGQGAVRTLFEAGGSLQELILLKKFAKEQTSLRNPELPDKVAMLFYFGTIAQGLSEHNRALSQLTPEKIDNGLRWCRAQRWADPLLHEVAQRGLDALQAD